MFNISLDGIKMSYVNWTKQPAGFNPVLKPYEREIIQFLDDIQTDLKDYKVTSLEVWEDLKDKGINQSRASVINFLELLRKQDIIYAEETTGKGGKRFSYRLKESETFEDVIKHLVFQMIGLMEAAEPSLNLWHDC